MVQGILANWKTSVLGLFVAVMTVAIGSYQHGMSWEQWALAAGIAIWGAVSRDFNVTSERSGAK